MGKLVFRSIVQFRLNKIDSHKTEDIIIIKDLKGDYTNQFITLLQDYYLHL